MSESQLFEENLKKLERDLKNLERRSFDEMKSDVTIRDRVRKRASSRQTSFSNLNQNTTSLRSQKSFVSNSFYRYHILDQIRIYVRSESSSMKIQA